MHFDSRFGGRTMPFKQGDRTLTDYPVSTKPNRSWLTFLLSGCN